MSTSKAPLTAARFYVIVFWAIVVAIGLASRLVSAIASLQRQEIDSEKRPGVFSWSALWLKRYVTVPAAFGYRCSQNLGWCTIPPRVQSLTIFAFVAVNVWYCVYGYYILPGHM